MGMGLTIELSGRRRVSRGTPCKCAARFDSGIHCHDRWCRAKAGGSPGPTCTFAAGPLTLSNYSVFSSRRALLRDHEAIEARAFQLGAGRLAVLLSRKRPNPHPV